MLDRMRLRWWLCLLYRPRRRGGPWLRSRPLLLHRPFRLSLPRWLARSLDVWPRLRNLLGHPCRRLRPYPLHWMHVGLVDRPGQRALLYSPYRYRLPPLDGQWPGHHYRLRPSAILRHELGAIGAGNHPVLLLHPQFREARLPQGS